MLDVSFLTLLSSLFFLAIGVGVIYLLVKVFMSGFDGSFGGVFERSAFRRQSVRCQQGDELLQKGDLAGAVRAFGSALFLRPIRQDSSLLTEVGKYHTGLLNRLLTVADEMDTGHTRLPSLAETDRLLAERLDICLDYFREKNEESGPVAPIEPRLKENEQQVRAAVDQLLNEITSSHEERVVYH